MWNVKSMGKGKFNTVKDKIKLPHIDILGIRLRWTGIGNFHQKVILLITQALEKKRTLLIL